jgi:hypothetical protein
LAVVLRTMGDRQTSRRGGNPDELIPGDHEAGWTAAEGLQSPSTERHGEHEGDQHHHPAPVQQRPPADRCPLELRHAAGRGGAGWGPCAPPTSPAETPPNFGSSLPPLHQPTNPAAPGRSHHKGPNPNRQLRHALPVPPVLLFAWRNRFPVQRPCRRPGSDSYPCPLRGTWWQGSRRFGRRGQTRRLVTVATGGRRLAHSIRFSTWRSSTKTDSGLHHPAAVRFRSLAPCVRQPYGWQEAGLLSPLPQLMPSR